MDRRALAKTYDQEVLPGWDGVFAPLLLEGFPTQLAVKAKLLEVGCSTGHLTEVVLQRMPAAARLVAVDDVREFIDVARHKVAEHDRKRVFFKKEKPGELTFADGAFDVVLCPGLPPNYDAGVMVREGGRLLKKGGFLLAGIALRGSFQELYDVFREVLEKEDLLAAQEGLDRLVLRLPDRAGALRLLDQAGLADGAVSLREHRLHYQSGIALVRAALVRDRCLDDVLSLVKDRGWREGVLAGVIRTMDTYFPEGLELTLIAARLSGTKA